MCIRARARASFSTDKPSRVYNTGIDTAKNTAVMIYYGAMVVASRVTRDATRHGIIIGGKRGNFGNLRKSCSLR